MNYETWNKVVDLWNSGMSIQEISKRTGVPERILASRLLGAVERSVRVQTNVAGRR